LATWAAVSGATGSEYREPSFVAPDRGLEEYLESLGLGPYADEAAAWEAYYSLAYAMDRSTWNTAYEAESINAYIRAGFEVAE